MNEDAALKQAALDKYDFTTCQRPDGSKYGSNGRCIKGSETSPASKDDKKGSSKSGGGGSTGKKKKGKWDDFNKKSKAEEMPTKSLRKKYANKKPDGGLTEAQVRAGGGRLD